MVSDICCVGNVFALLDSRHKSTFLSLHSPFNRSLQGYVVFVVATRVRGYKDTRGLFRSRKKECEEYLAQAWSWVVVAALRR